MDVLLDKIGDSGSPRPSTSAHVLECARPGNTDSAMQFRSGAQALVFRVTRSDRHPPVRCTGERMACARRRGRQLHGIFAFKEQLQAPVWHARRAGQENGFVDSLALPRGIAGRDDAK